MPSPVDYDAARGPFVGQGGVTSIDDTVDGMLRVEGDRLVVQWRLVRTATVVARSGTAILLLFAWACTAESPPPQRADPEAAFRARLGHEWTLVRLGAYEVPPPPPGARPDTPGNPIPGSRPTVTFTADMRVGGRSFCNAWGGSYTMRGDTLHIPMIEGTAVGCDGPDSLETRFFRAFRGTPRVAIDSATLVLVGEDGTRLTFVADTAGLR